MLLVTGDLLGQAPGLPDGKMGQRRHEQRPAFALIDMTNDAAFVAGVGDVDRRVTTVGVDIEL